MGRKPNRAYLKYLFLLFILSNISCQEVAREFAAAQNTTPHLIFSSDSLAIHIDLGVNFKSKKAEKLYAKVLDIMPEGDMLEARGYLKEALKEEPGNPVLLLGISHTYFFAGNLYLAEQYLNKSMEVTGRNFPPALYSSARLNAAKENHKTALSLVEELLAQIPEEDVWQRIGVMHLKVLILLQESKCKEAGKAFYEFDKLASLDNSFKAVQNEMRTRVVQCTGEELEESFHSWETGELLATIKTERYFPTFTAANPEPITRIFLAEWGNEKDYVYEITKKEFRDYLYKDFYENSHINASGITGRMGDQIFGVTELAVTGGENLARIFYQMDIKKEATAEIEILKVIYSNPTANVGSKVSTDAPYNFNL